MWVGFSLVNGCVTTLKSFFFPQQDHPGSDSYFSNLVPSCCFYGMWVGQWLFFSRSGFNWSSVCEGSDWKGFLPRQIMVSSDSHALWCTLSELVLDRRWLWLCRNSGKLPKIHRTTVFFLLLALLCWRTCRVLISQCPGGPVSAALRSWAVRDPALVQALRDASLLQTMLVHPIHVHSFFWGLFLWIPPSSP